jgi:endonuclease/exonuclease/phosphatase (EEP) superfamily protein YafD
VQENGMKDVWVELVKNDVAPTDSSETLGCSNPSTTTACETVDKVFYRGSSAVTLQANSFDYAGDMFLQADGSILSDHNPVLVEFAWTLNSKLAVSDTV